MASRRQTARSPPAAIHFSSFSPAAARQRSGHGGGSSCSQPPRQCSMKRSALAMHSSESPPASSQRSKRCRAFQLQRSSQVGGTSKRAASSSTRGASFCASTAGVTSRAHGKTSHVAKVRQNTVGLDTARRNAVWRDTSPYVLARNPCGYFLIGGHLCWPTDPNGSPA